MLFKVFAKLKMQNRSILSIFILVISSLSLVLFFQNCGKAGFDASNDGSSNVYSPSSVAPFAFEASIDMITYNSCNSSASQGQTFTFKAGSYESGVSSTGSLTEKVPKSGVRLTQEFVEFIKSSLKPDYPNPDITTEQVQRLMKQSLINAEAQPQISLRSINKGNRLGNVFFKKGSPSIGIDVIQLLGDLTDIRWADTIIAAALPNKTSIQNVDYFPKAPAGARNIEASFHFNTNAQTAEAYRNAFNKIGDVDAQIVVGFSYTNEAMLISPEASDTDMMTTANARGYQMTFQIPVDTRYTPSSWAYHPNNQVAKIDEYNLLTNKVISDANWDCGARFKIVRAEDASFLWSTLDSAVNQSVLTDSGVAAESKESVKAGIKVNLAQYYRYLNSDSTLNVDISGKVVNTAIATAGLCPKMDYTMLNVVPSQDSIYGVGVYAGKTYAQILEIVRRHLPDNQWDINLAYGCVVPKKFSCYPDESRKAADGGTYAGKYKVTYQPNLACHHKFDPNYYKANKTDSNNAIPTDYCTEYVTVCTKR